MESRASYIVHVLEIRVGTLQRMIKPDAFSLIQTSKFLIVFETWEYKTYTRLQKIIIFLLFEKIIIFLLFEKSMILQPKIQRPKCYRSLFHVQEISSRVKFIKVMVKLEISGSLLSLEISVWLDKRP